MATKKIMRYSGFLVVRIDENIVNGSHMTHVELGDRSTSYRVFPHERWMALSKIRKENKSVFDQIAREAIEKSGFLFAAEVGPRENENDYINVKIRRSNPRKLGNWSKIRNEWTGL